MTQWIMAHPWMFFFLVVLGLIVIDNISNNITRASIAKVISKERQAQNEEEAITDEQN